MVMTSRIATRLRQGHDHGYERGPHPNSIAWGRLVTVTDVEAGALGATDARAEALPTMARRETGRRDLSLAEAEEWWAARRDEMGLRSRWPSG